MIRTAMIRTFGLAKRFGAVEALAPLSLEIAAGEFFALLGASGSGKTTLLRLLGGFERPSAGGIEIDGRDVTDMPPHRRPTNTVFQSYALFPHLTLEENAGYGLLNRPISSARRREIARDALDRVRLADLGQRYPHEISGGQRQRVALARALVCEPKVLLLDEPLGALDKRLREEMQIELRLIQLAAGITFILVTHDQEEAMSLADRVAVMARGRVLQIGAPRDLYERPTSRAVARFISNINIFEGRCIERDDARVRIVVESEADGRPIPLVASADGPWPRPGDTVGLAVRPEKLRLDPADGSANQLDGVIVGESYVGDRTHLHVAVMGLRDPVLVTVTNNERAPALSGSGVRLGWSPAAGVLLRD